MPSYPYMFFPSLTSHMKQIEFTKNLKTFSSTHLNHSSSNSMNLSTFNSALLSSLNELVETIHSILSEIRTESNDCLSSFFFKSYFLKNRRSSIAVQNLGFFFFFFLY
jgi:hypothetical protein